jgi:hypothetical protein
MFHVVKTAPPLVALESCIYGPIVIHLGDRVWTTEPSSRELAVWVLFDHDLVSYVVGVRDALGILLLVVLEDTMLLSFLNVVPIRLEGDV